MADPGSVSIWLSKIPQKDQEAFAQLWKRYFRRLVEFARRRLHKGPRTVRDEEDIAVSAFNTFYQNAEQGRIPKLNDRDDLWAMLVVITRNKLSDHIEREQAQKRDWRRTQHGFSTPGDEDSEAPLMFELLSDLPTPDFAAEVADNCRYLLAALGEDKYRQVALLKLEGWSNKEIAERIGRSERLVNHRLQVIREAWREEQKTMMKS